MRPIGNDTVAGVDGSKGHFYLASDHYCHTPQSHPVRSYEQKVLQFSHGFDGAQIARSIGLLVTKQVTRSMEWGASLAKATAFSLRVLQAIIPLRGPNLDTLPASQDLALRIYCIERDL